MNSKKIFDLILKEAKGYEYSHSLKKYDLKDIRALFLDTESLCKYFFSHPSFLECSCCDELDFAKEAGRENGFEEGFLPEAFDAVDKAVDVIFSLTDLLDPNEEITLYRGVELIEDIKPDIENPGICWTFDRKTAEKFVSQFDDQDDPNTAPCILEGVTKISNVDWLITALLLSDMPEEREIRLWDDSLIKVVDWEVL